jgi:hypothetical protein
MISCNKLLSRLLIVDVMSSSSFIYMKTARNEREREREGDPETSTKNDIVPKFLIMLLQFKLYFLFLAFNSPFAHLYKASSNVCGPPVIVETFDSL